MSAVMNKLIRHFGALGSSLLLALGFVRASEKIDPLCGDFGSSPVLVAADEPGEPPCIVPPAPPPPPDPIDPDQPASPKPQPEA